MFRASWLVRALVLFTTTADSYVLVRDSHCTKADNRTGVCKTASGCPELLNSGSGRRKSRRYSCTQDLVCCPFGRRNSASSLMTNQRPQSVHTSHNDKCNSLAGGMPPDPKSGCCGREVGVQNRIVGGSDAGLEQYPWMALLEYRNEFNRQLDMTCGGFLVSSRYVITAKHCVQNLGTAQPTHVHLAEYDTRTSTDCVTVEGGGEDCINMTAIAVEEVTTHPDQDIALIRLETAVPYTDFIRPICLPTEDITENPPAADLNFFVAGWGVTGYRKSPIKMQVEVPYVPAEKCQTILKDTVRAIEENDKMICAGGAAGHDSCRGDSGGPLMYDNGDYMEVSGIISFGDPHCGRKGIPAVHVNVHKNLDWIFTNIEDQILRLGLFG